MGSTDGCWHSSTGISPRPMLMGAPRNALRAFNAGVSLSCLYVVAHKLPHLFYSPVWSLRFFPMGKASWRTCRTARHRQNVSVCPMMRRYIRAYFSKNC